jgi:Secretion system C-terminal sorting domain
MKKIYLLPLMLLLCGTAWTQSGATSQKMRIPLGGTVDVQAQQADFEPLLVRVEAPAPDGRSEKARIAAIKQHLATQRHAPQPATQKVDSTAPSPWIGTNYQSNQVITGVPNDNDMAIGNDGRVVSVVNSTLFFHSASGSLLSYRSLDAWAAPLGISGSKFDPRALYDPTHDRFVIVCLNGYTDSTSLVIVGFSQTNDPGGAYNLYALPGDPNNDSLWTDYPIMALSGQELFLTGNLLYNDQPWQTGFHHSICWQIDLDSAYAGGTLDTRLWSNVNFGGAPVRNLCPIQSGSAPSDNNMYLLSNRNLTLGNDTVFIMEITDTLNAPGVQFLVNYGISNAPYSLPPSAVQSANNLLATNDARCLDGFIENGNIQFVGNTRDASTGRSGFYHGIITDITGARTVTGTVIGNPTGDYGYPAIAWMGMNAGEDAALLAINYCGPTIPLSPGCGGIYYDGLGGYSPLVVAKRGVTFINALVGEDRWGDYTGVQRKYDEAGVVWMAATFAKSNHDPGTWIAEFHHPSIVAINPPPFADGFEATVYPNPTADMVMIEFALEADAFLDISIWDAQGRKVKTLVRDRVRAGTNRMSCATAPLAAGVYFLRILDGDRVLATKRIERLD